MSDPFSPLYVKDLAQAYADTGNALAMDLRPAALARAALKAAPRTRASIEPKSAVLNMRLPLSLLDAVKAEARSRGIPYTRYVRMLLEKAADRAAASKDGTRSRYG